jgi:tRNA-specific 2-thiouridylase
VFVAAKDLVRNALIVVQGHDHPALYRSIVEAQEMHWIAGAPPQREQLGHLGAKTRYRMPDAKCRIELLDDGRARAIFDAPQWAPTAGQYLVLYDGDVCLGGGVIAATSSADVAVTSEVAAAH